MGLTLPATRLKKLQAFILTCNFNAKTNSYTRITGMESTYNYLQVYHYETGLKC